MDRQTCLFPFCVLRRMCPSDVVPGVLSTVGVMPICVNVTHVSCHIGRHLGNARGDARAILLEGLTPGLALTLFRGD
eukprot:1671551-Prymnesium_polylepis.2